jgi:hypothetical protein
MRKYIGYALIVVAIVTLLVWAISQFVQPLLPGNINGSLILLFAALMAAAIWLGAIKDVAELLRNWFEQARGPEPPHSIVIARKEPEAEKGEVEPDKLSTKYRAPHPRRDKECIKSVTTISDRNRVQKLRRNKGQMAFGIL